MQNELRRRASTFEGNTRYPNVSWYRGGLEAWDVAGFPVTRLK
jgi:rhodanese-related sulfurtransferase